jgi:hypothetical protein
MRAIEAIQAAQAAEMAELRARSEVALRAWYEGSVMARSQFMADVEGRVQRVEQAVRRVEHEREVAEQV